MSEHDPFDDFVLPCDLSSPLYDQAGGSVSKIEKSGTYILKQTDIEVHIPFVLDNKDSPPYIHGELVIYDTSTQQCLTKALYKKGVLHGEGTLFSEKTGLPLAKYTMNEGKLEGDATIYDEGDSTIWGTFSKEGTFLKGKKSQKSNSE